MGLLEKLKPKFWDHPEKVPDVGKQVFDLKVPGVARQMFNFQRIWKQAV